MHRRLRDLHLILGLLTAVFLLGYGLSAALMAYPIRRAWSTETRRDVEVPPGVDTAPRLLARWLMAEHGLRGDLTQVKATGTTVELGISRPGTTYRIEYEVRTRRARVTTEVFNAIGMIQGLHESAGLRHDDWAMNAWGWCLLAVSIGLLLLAASGVVMWFSRYREPRSGAVVLVAGLAWGLGLLLLIRYS